MTDIKAGDRVRVTIEGEVGYVGSHDIRLDIPGREYWIVHEDATVETIEPEYKPNTLVFDALGRQFLRRGLLHHKPWMVISTPFPEPGYEIGKTVSDSLAARPLTVLTVPVDGA